MRVQPIYAKFADLDRRLETFADWPSNHSVPKNVAAHAGFFYTGYSDCIRCFFCGGGLRHWVPADDVWLEHAHWFPSCQLLQQTLGQDLLEAITLLVKDHDQLSWEMVGTKLCELNNQRKVQTTSQQLPQENDEETSPRPGPRAKL